MMIRSPLFVPMDPRNPAPRCSPLEANEAEPQRNQWSFRTPLLWRCGGGSHLSAVSRHRDQDFY